MERKFYYLPTFIGWVNINAIECIDIKDNTIYLACGKVIHNVPIDELNYIMVLEQQQFFNENKKRI